MHLVETRKSNGPFLIASPSSLVANWAAELARWAPSLTVATYVGSPAERLTVFAHQVYLSDT